MKRCYVKVATYCLLEIIQKLYEQGARELAVGKEDGEWLISFDRAGEKDRNDLIKAREKGNK